jgi:hypothetical protein
VAHSDADYRCNLCWDSFESPVALLLHEAAEDDRLYDIDGLYAPSNQGPTRCVE